jgi:hypothetical protein
MSNIVGSVNILTGDEDRDYLNALRSLKAVRTLTGTYDGELDDEIKELEQKQKRVK